MSGDNGSAPDAVLRLRSGKAGEAFLHRHHVEAAIVLTRLFERARIRQRVTMSYDPARIGSTGGHSGQADLADSAADARTRLNRLATRLGGDCWGVLADVCGHEKGLQLIETERGWPRRSAKLVLRIGLEQTCALLGLTPEAKGPDQAKMTGWLEARPAMFPDDPH